MKKLICGILAVITMMSVSGCGSKDSRTVEQDEQESSTVTEVQGDYMEKYIAQLDSSEKRTSFLSFWNSMTSYCMGIEIELRKIDNTEKYTFDPMNKEAIPEAIRDIYDFAELKFFSGYSDHKDFQVTIDGKKVEFSFDGETFYPTNYGYTEVKNLVEKYNAE